MKFDYKLGDRNSIAVRYLLGDSLQSGPPFAGLQAGGSNPSSLFNSTAASRAQLGGVSWTWTVSNNKILESRLGYTRFSQLIDVNNKIDPKSLGIDTGPLGSADFGVPYVDLYHLGYGGYIGGVQGYPLVTRPDQTIDWSEHFSWVKGNHTMKMGGNFQRAYTNSIRNNARTGITAGYFQNYTGYGHVSGRSRWRRGRIAAGQSRPGGPDFWRYPSSHHAELGRLLRAGRLEDKAPLDAELRSALRDQRDHARQR